MTKEVPTDSFEVISEDGQEFIITVYTTMTESRTGLGTHAKPGLNRLVLSNGEECHYHHNNDTYTTVETNMILTRIEEVA